MRHVTYESSSKENIVHSYEQEKKDAHMYNGFDINADMLQTFNKICNIMLSNFINIRFCTQNRRRAGKKSRESEKKRREIVTYAVHAGNGLDVYFGVFFRHQLRLGFLCGVCPCSFTPMALVRPMCVSVGAMRRELFWWMWNVCVCLSFFSRLMSPYYSFIRIVCPIELPLLLWTLPKYSGLSSWFSSYRIKSYGAFTVNRAVCIFAYPIAKQSQ